MRARFNQSFKLQAVEKALSREPGISLSVSGLKSAPTFAEYPWAHSRAIMPQLSQVYRRRRYG